MNTLARVPRLCAVILVTSTALVLGGAGPAQAAGNAHASGRPEAGSVGRADSKTPPGQASDGSDRNNGYECDANNGVGPGNPAHSGCAEPPTLQF